MILTDKCLEDFRKYISFHHGLDLNDWEVQKQVFLNALIIEFFDSVGITIEITVDVNNSANSCDEYCENCDSCYDTWDSEFEYCVYVFTEIVNNINDYSTHFSEDSLKTRLEAINQAIEKANEIYNSKEK